MPMPMFEREERGAEVARQRRRRRTEASRHQWHAVVGLAILAGTGCATIKETQQSRDVPVRSYTERQVGKEWKWKAALTAKADSADDTITVTGNATRYHVCNETAHEVVDRTVTTKRLWTDENSSGRYNIYFWSGVALIASVAGGAYVVSKAESGDDRAGGYAIMTGGGLASISFPIVNEIRASDSSSTDRVDLPTSKTDSCDVEKLAGAAVRITAGDGTVLFDRAATAKGSFEAVLGADDVEKHGPPFKVSVAGKEVGEAPELAAARTSLTVAKARDRASAAAQRRAAEARKALSDESRSGRCTDEHHAAFEVAVNQAKHVFTASDGWDLVGHDMLPATESGAKLSLRTGIGGETHIFALGFAPLELEVRDRHGYPVTLESNFVQMFLYMSQHSQSRVVQANMGEEIEIQVKGVGCVLAMAFKRYGH
jgi:hypothetical protein